MKAEAAAAAAAWKAEAEAVRSEAGRQMEALRAEYQGRAREAEVAHAAAMGAKEEALREAVSKAQVSGGKGRRFFFFGFLRNNLCNFFQFVCIVSARYRS